MQITTVGLDLAKNIFQIHGISGAGEIAFNRSLRRNQVLSFFEKLAPCLVGMEACGISHHLARELANLGHEVRLIPPMYVKPYVKRGKSDAAGAEAICEAVSRPTMRFVEIKTVDQQAVLFLHRARDLIVRQRTQLINMLRAILAEFGIIIAQGIGRAISFAEAVGEGDVPDLPEVAQDVIANLGHQLVELHLRVRWPLSYRAALVGTVTPTRARALVRTSDEVRSETRSSRNDATHDPWRRPRDCIGYCRHCWQCSTLLCGSVRARS